MGRIWAIIIPMMIISLVPGSGIIPTQEVYYYILIPSQLHVGDEFPITFRAYVSEPTNFTLWIDTTWGFNLTFSYVEIQYNTYEDQVIWIELPADQSGFGDLALYVDDELERTANVRWDRTDLGIPDRLSYYSVDNSYWTGVSRVTRATFYNNGTISYNNTVTEDAGHRDYPFNVTSAGTGSIGISWEEYFANITGFGTMQTYVVGFIPSTDGPEGFSRLTLYWGEVSRSILVSSYLDEIAGWTEDMEELYKLLRSSLSDLILEEIERTPGDQDPVDRVPLTISTGWFIGLILLPLILRRKLK